MLVIGLVGGCSEGGEPVGPGVSAPAPATADPSATEDVPGERACTALREAVRDATIMTPGVVDTVVTAAGAADAPIADAAQRLGAAYAEAVAARGTDGEPDAVAGVSAAAAEMSRLCEESGLETVG